MRDCKKAREDSRRGSEEAGAVLEFILWALRRG